VTIDYHRFSPHGASEVKRWLEVVPAVAGGMSLQGSVTEWVTDHRRHRASSDKAESCHNSHHPDAIAARQRGGGRGDAAADVVSALEQLG
jgi:fatty-acid desaturase